MGNSRADFYWGRIEPIWIGSIPRDGDLFDLPSFIRSIVFDEDWLIEIDTWIDFKKGHRLKDGWPWTYPTSAGTEVSYTIELGLIYFSLYGDTWRRLDGGICLGSIPKFPEFPQSGNIDELVASIKDEYSLPFAP